MPRFPCSLNTNSYTVPKDKDTTKRSLRSSRPLNVTKSWKSLGEWGLTVNGPYVDQPRHPDCRNNNNPRSYAGIDNAHMIALNALKLPYRWRIAWIACNTTNWESIQHEIKESRALGQTHPEIAIGKKGERKRRFRVWGDRSKVEQGRAQGETLRKANETRGEGARKGAPAEGASWKKNGAKNRTNSQKVPAQKKRPKAGPKKKSRTLKTHNLGSNLDPHQITTQDTKLDP